MLGLASLPGCADAEPIGDGTHVGLLLDFTGALAGSGANIEKAGILAAEEINAVGGVAGDELFVVVADTHTDLAWGRARAEAMLQSESVDLVLGPELASIAAGIDELADREDALFVLPGLTKPAFELQDPLLNTVTMSPSTSELACALATRIARDKHRDVLIVAERDEFHQSLAMTMLEIFTSQGSSFRPNQGRVVVLAERPSVDPSRMYTVGSGAEFGAGQWSSVTMREVIDTKIAAVAVAAFAYRGSELLWLFGSSNPGASYYVSPALNAQGVLDALPEALKPNLLGIGPIEDDSTGFETNFRDRWGDEIPFSESWFYFDAMVMSALALEAFRTDPSRTLREHMLEISRPPGDLIRWNDLGQGLETLRNGGSVNYHGVTSPCDIKDDGQLKDGLFILRYWKIEDGIRTPELFVNCGRLPTAG